MSPCRRPSGGTEEGAWSVPGPSHDEHIGAVSIAPTWRDRGNSRMRRSVPGGSHRSVSKAPLKRDAGLTAPDAAFLRSCGTPT